MQHGSKNKVCQTQMEDSVGPDEVSLLIPHLMAFENKYNTL